ncbi:hypothetical protein D3C75_1132070 [compost metagenome]
MNAGSGRFPGGGCRTLSGQLRIPGAAHGQRNREDGLVAVDNIRHEQQRNTQPVVPQVSLLHPDDGFGSRKIKGGAAGIYHRSGDTQLLHGAGEQRLLLKAFIKSSGKLQELGNLLLQRHAANQRL